MVSTELPWGVQKQMPPSAVDYGILPGKFAAQSLLVEIFAVFDRKLLLLEDDPVEKVLNKTLKKGEDTYLDNLIRTLHGFCQSCLPSILGVLIKWYEHQQTIGLTDSSKSDTKGRLAKRLLAVDYLFCIVLIDVLPQIHFHPDACDEHVNKIVKLSFHQIVFRDITALGGPVNYNNSMIVSDTFAEVLGVLSASHFGLIQNMFFSHLNELKTESPINTNRIIHLLMAMKFFRIKLTLPEIERGAEFLDKLGTYFLDVDAKQKDIKHAVAGLLVEILLPVAATIKTEANIPSLIAFVDKLYGPTYDLVNKRQHKMAAYPLLTCLLCISQSKFFFANWTQFLNATLAQLKNRDSKLSRVALESLYRLLWVYIIRNNGEGNTTTRSKLETICGSLFPKGNRSVVPREAPLNIFVKIIHFIAQQKLDFAFKEIIFDLLGCNRSSRSMTLYPERMNIGIRALMVIADGLQQKEGPPGMPRSLGPLASGTIQRNKKTYITRPLTADVARSIGLEQYYLNCRKAFDSILRMLDVQVGRPLMLTQVQTKGKDPIEILGGDTKPKLDLFRTCIAAIPRLLPDTMTHQELVELLTRLTIHMDDELRAMACQTLQNLLTECAEWREDIIMIYLSFITTQVQDTFPVLFEGSVRLLMQLMCMWKSSIQLDKKKVETDSAQTTPPTNHISSFVNPAAPRTTSLQAAPVVASSLGLAAGAASRIFGHTSGAASEGGQPNRNAVLNPQNHVVTVSSSTALHSVEGFALTLLCQIRTQPKKIAVQLMKEVKQIFALLGITALDGLVINVLDEATPYVVEKYIEHVPWSERQNWPKDFASAYEKISGIVTDNCLVNADKGNEYMQWDPWACALSGYCEDRFLLSQCSQAVAFAWPVLVSRWNVCNSFVDPNNPQNESRNSLLRTSKSKASAVSICGESLTQESYLALWQKYFVMCCALAPPNSNKRLVRSFSPNVSIESDFLRGMARSTTSSTSSKSSINSHGMSVSQFFQKVVPMLRWDQTDMKDSVVLSIGSTNSFVFEILLEELRGQLREAQERKAEKVRGRKRRDQLRLQLTRMFEVAIFRGSLEPSGLVDAQSGQLSTLLLEFLDFIRLSTENDQDRDTVILTSLRLHFAKVVSLLVNSVYPDRRRNLLPNDKKQKWFAQFTSWGGRMIAMNERRRESDVGTYVEQKAVHALCALLCCGPIFEAQKSLGDDGYLYGWLEALMASNHHTVQLLCEETLSVMLNVNDQNAQLLDWTIQMCYTKSNVVGARCFKALVMLFSKREYPCDFVCLFVLCQMFIEDVGDSDISAMATQLLHLLKKQFLDESPTLLPRPPSSSDILESSPVVRVMANGTTGEKFAKGHLAVSKQLAKDYSQLTMPIFSEVCSRIDTARTFRQSTLLSLLIPWMENIELVDSNAYLTEPATLTEEKDDSVPFGGSEEATQLVLNNLLYMTITLASEHDAEVGTLWKVLASTRDSNLQIILHYLFVMMVLSPEAMISPAKRIVQHLSQTNGIRLVELLMENLIGSNDYFKQSLSRSDMAPYYRWICPAPQSPTEEQEAPSLAEPQERMIRSDPYQLPMPAYGGHYSNLLGHLPPTSQQVTIFTRSNLSLFLISDLIGTECPGIEWRHHLPVILHIAVLGLDSPRSYVCRYSKECIINLCLLVAAQSVGLSSVANIILQNRLGSSSCSAVSSPVTASSAARGETPTFASIRHAEYRTMLLQSNAVFTSSGELLQAIVFCLSDQLEKPLWINEEAGPRQWKLDSADQLGCMARHLAEFFLQNPMDVSGPPLVVRWTDIAMKQALGNSNRHIVGRCLQIAAALCQSPREWIAPLVSRIAECVGDSHEENQTLVTCLMLYLHQTVPYLSASHKPSDHLRTSTGGGHSRSISYTPDLLRQSTTQSPSSAHSRVPHFERHSMMVDTDMLAAAAAQFQSQGSTDMPSPISSPSGLTRSKSATTLNSEHSPVEQEHITALVQLLAISVAMLESPIDHEYLLALTLLERTFEVAGSAKKEALEALAVMLKQMEWKPFPGIVGLLSKGTVIAYGYETSVGLLVKSVDLLDASVVASPNAFALIVVSIVPHCLLHFDAPTELCINAADVISQYCSTNIPDMSNSELSPADHPLHNLSTMMHQYAEHVFSRDRFQWAKCVINYLVDAVKPDIAQLIILLAEMLERSAFVLHVYLLHMIYLLVSHGDLNDASPIPINAQVIRIVTRHVQGVNWKEAARVLKSVVEQWNSIGGGTSTTTLNDNYDRMSIDVDLTKPPVDKTSPPTLRRANGMSLLPATSATFTGDSLKRQTNQQNKVREHLVGILTASGMKVRLPQSTSIVLSQSSSDLRQLHHEHAVGDTSSIVQPALNSAFNSSEQISHPDDLDALSGSSTAIGDHTSIATDSFPRVFKEFDFLEAEHDSISESAESCFNWLSTIRPRSMSNVDDLNESGGGAPTITGVDDEDYNAADDEEEDEDDDDQDSVDGDDEDEYTVRARIKVLPRGSGGRRSNFSRRAAAMRRYKVTVGALPGPLKSHSESEGNIPGSPASDSNDISSDRTPHQSDVERDRHSDALSSHGSDIDDEELDRDDEELEALELKSEARDEEDVDSAPKTAITIGSESEPRPESTGDSVTGGGLTEEMLFLSETASSVKCQSEISAFSEMRERAIQKKTYPLLLECNHHASGQVEQLWIGTVGDVNNDLDGEATSYAILLFSQLLRECCSKISGLFRDASHLISVSGSQSPRNINFHFSRTLEVLMKVTESPFLFVTAQFLRASNMLQQEQFSLYELREHFETFTERKEHCIRALNAVKSSVKLLMMGGGGAGLSANQEVDLCRSLQKLFFQLSLMAEKLKAMISAIAQSTNAQEFDLSPAVLSLQRDLLLHVANDCGLNDSGSVSSLSKSGLSIGGDQYADSLILQLANKNYGHALNTLRHLRSQQGTEFGCCDTMDVEVLLMQFCRSHTLRAWAVVGSMQALNTNCTQMKETNLQLSSLVRALMVDVNAAANTKSSRVSSVTESMFMTSLH